MQLHTTTPPGGNLQQCLVLYPEHVIDEINQAPEEKWRAIDGIFLWRFVCESEKRTRGCRSYI